MKNIPCLIVIFLLVSSCSEKPTYDNPLDPDNNPQNWAPNNLQFIQITISSVKLFWLDNCTSEQGYIIDKKISNEEWQIAFKTLPSNTIEFIDDSFIPSETHYYRVYAFAGDMNSSYEEIEINPSLLAPQNLQLSYLDFYSIKLTWEDCCNGEEGYKIDKRVGNQAWISYTTLGPNDTEYIDNSASCLDSTSYRVFSYVSNYNSQYTIETISSFVQIVGGCFLNGRKAESVIVSGNYAYITTMINDSGLSIVDISDPSNPILVGSCNTPDNAYDISLSNNYAYIASWASGLQVINISDQETPSIVGSCDTPQWACDINISGNYAYVADVTSLQVINISNPSNPNIVSFCDTPSAIGIHISGIYAYIAGGSYGLQIINISDPMNPYIVGSCDTPDYAREINVSGNYAYIADEDSGMQIVNVSNPSNPFIVGSYATSSYTLDIKSNDNYAYLTFSNKLHIINISNPADPYILSSCDTNWNAKGVFINSAFAYIADNSSGLTIVQIEP